MPPKPSFLQRHRGVILGAVLVLGLGLVGGFAFLAATSPSYACTTIWQPPSPDPDPDSLGAPQSDMGRTHVPPGQFVRYTYCPPASGPHVNAANQGPIAARFYGPDDQTVPQGWIHNLEHGGMVVLYSCSPSCPSQADLTKLQDFVRDFPESPICGLPAGRVGPVVARFDQQGAPFAGLLWDRVLYQPALDVPQLLEFFRTEARTDEPRAALPAEPVTESERVAGGQSVGVTSRKPERFAGSERRAPRRRPARARARPPAPARRPARADRGPRQAP